MNRALAVRSEFARSLDAAPLLREFLLSTPFEGEGLGKPNGLEDGISPSVHQAAWFTTGRRLQRNNLRYASLAACTGPENALVSLRLRNNEVGKEKKHHARGDDGFTSGEPRMPLPSEITALCVLFTRVASSGLSGQGTAREFRGHFTRRRNSSGAHREEQPT
jgi:hypothetical protein